MEMGGYQRDADRSTTELLRFVATGEVQIARNGGLV
jgi:hypothetical protein